MRPLALVLALAGGGGGGAQGHRGPPLGGQSAALHHRVPAPGGAGALGEASCSSIWIRSPMPAPGCRAPGAWLAAPGPGGGALPPGRHRPGAHRRGPGALAPRILGFDVEEFLEEDQDEPELVGAAAVDEAARGRAGRGGAAAGAHAGPGPNGSTPTVVLPVGVSPSGRGRPVPVAAFRQRETFGEAERAVTVERILGWWSEEAVDDPRPAAADFGLDAETFQEDPEQGIFRLAVAAALAFGPDAHRAVARFRPCATRGRWTPCTRRHPPRRPRPGGRGRPHHGLRGSAPGGRGPDLAATLERADDADAPSSWRWTPRSGEALRPGLFWMIWTLAGLGVIRRRARRPSPRCPTGGCATCSTGSASWPPLRRRHGAAARAAAAATVPFGAGAHHALVFARSAGCALAAASASGATCPAGSGPIWADR
ncbi:MAG: hypothetical protein R3F43_27285 [bacterium]